VGDEKQPFAVYQSFLMRTTPFSVGFGFAVLMGILLFMVPKFELMFKEMELGQLPFMTQVLMATAHFAWRFWYVLPGILAVTVWLSAKMSKSWSSALAVNVSMMLVLGLSVAFVALALFVPLITIMEKVGR